MNQNILCHLCRSLDQAEKELAGLCCRLKRKPKPGGRGGKRPPCPPPEEEYIPGCRPKPPDFRPPCGREECCGHRK